MKKLLNTLFVTTEGSYLCRDGETVLIRVKDETKGRFPIHLLGGIVCIGQVMCSPPLMQLCVESKVSLSFLSQYGRFIAKVQGPVSGNVLLRRQQYRFADCGVTSAKIARLIVYGKVANCRTVLMRAAREHNDSDAAKVLTKVADSMGYRLKQMKEEQTVDSWRGVEGEAAQLYFSAFDHLILAQKQDFYFRQRTRRPPLDNMNALLSFYYTLLAHDVSSALETVGLDPAVGFLHRDRPGRPSLALDLMEELRPHFADRVALTLVNRQQIKGRGFKMSESGAVIMNDETRKEVLVAYQNRKKEEVEHPFLGEKIAIGLIPHVQAMLLARYIRGDLEAYPPFLWK